MKKEGWHSGHWDSMGGAWRAALGNGSHRGGSEPWLYLVGNVEPGSTAHGGTILVSLLSQTPLPCSEHEETEKGYLPAASGCLH